MAVVTFDPDEFRGQFPDYAEMTDAQLNGFFDTAEILVDNSDSSSIPYNPPKVKVRKVLLYAVVCHLAYLYLRGTGLVGRLTNGTQGDVTGGFAAGTNPNSAWWDQSQCGATAWMIIQQYAVGGLYYGGCFR